MTGHPHLSEIDLVARGAKNVVVGRTYLSPYMPVNFKTKRYQDIEVLREYIKSYYQGWTHFPHLYAEYHKAKSKLRITTPQGATIDYRIAFFPTLGPVLYDKPYGISNLGQDSVGAQYGKC